MLNGQRPLMGWHFRAFRRPLLRIIKKSKPVKIMASTISAHPAAFGFGPEVHGGKKRWKKGIDQYNTGSHDSGHLTESNDTELPAQKAASSAAFDVFIAQVIFPVWQSRDYESAPVNFCQRLFARQKSQFLALEATWEHGE